MDYKIFIEASYINNIHTGEKVSLQLLLLKVCESFLFGDSKNCSTLWSVMSFFYISREQNTK